MLSQQIKAFDWFLPIRNVKGVGEHIAMRLEKLNMLTQGDLLLHCPYRYENRTQITPIRHLQDGQWTLIQGEIRDLQEIKRGKKRCTLQLQDKTGTLELVFFNYYPTQKKLWQIGNTLRCYGQVKKDRLLAQMIHPEYDLVKEDAPLAPTLTPIYPTMAGLPQGLLRKLIQQALQSYTQQSQHVKDEVAVYLNQAYSCVQALNCIHAPMPHENQEALLNRTHLAYQRLIQEELLIHHLSLKQTRDAVQKQEAYSLAVNTADLTVFLQNLRFQLTEAQQRVWLEIQADLKQNVPMLRLVQGDVGCGKTVIAALSALCAVSQKKQVAIMAPTEILAEQHAQQFTTWFAVLGIRVVHLNGRLKAKEKRILSESIQQGGADIVVGTHALFQDTVQFHDLALVIIDEQHRFGVHQRLSLQRKGNHGFLPHQLIMTATPIPRTLAMSHYAHLDISIIDSLPPGRKAVKTIAIANGKRDEIIEKIKSVCKNKNQVYWVCTLIEDSEVLTCQAATANFEYLQKALPYPCGLAHGRLADDEKQAVMQAFYRNEISVLVATTVIEVGVNVPNATLMIIENPERLGLAQLHQLRGRVGRGSDESFCVLLYQPPLSPMAKARINIMRETNDGFKIAEGDLALRGPGELLGSRQTGMVQFKIADLNRDKALMEIIAKRADQAHLEKSLLAVLCKRWGLTLEFSQA